jgi:hypothetical protein
MVYKDPRLAILQHHFVTCERLSKLAGDLETYNKIKSPGIPDATVMKAVSDAISRKLELRLNTKFNLYALEGWAFCAAGCVANTALRG